MVVFMNEWLNIMELAERANIPDTTVRRYIAKFSVFFFHVGGKRSRRYKSSAVDILLRIKALYDGGYQSSEVAKQLEKDFPMILDGDKTDGNLEKADTPALMTAEDIWEMKQELIELKDIKKELKSTQDELKAVKEIIEKMPRNFLDLENSMKELLRKQNQLLLGKPSQEEEEKELVSKEEKKEGFFKRLFKK